MKDKNLEQTKDTRPQTKEGFTKIEGSGKD